MTLPKTAWNKWVATCVALTPAQGPRRGNMADGEGRENASLLFLFDYPALSKNPVLSKWNRKMKLKGVLYSLLHKCAQRCRKAFWGTSALVSKVTGELTLDTVSFNRLVQERVNVGCGRNCKGCCWLWWPCRGDTGQAVDIDRFATVLHHHVLVPAVSLLCFFLCDNPLKPRP